MTKTLTALMLLLTLTACDSSQRERLNAERADRHYQDALARYKAGDVKGAEQSFRRAVKDDPVNASAHFQLAVLLQERGDYLGALSHYKTYLQLAPDTEKAPLAKERLALCAPQFVEQYAREHDYPTRAERAELQERYEEATNALARVTAESRRAADEVNMLKAKLDRLQTRESTPRAALSAASERPAVAGLAKPDESATADGAEARPVLLPTRPTETAEEQDDGLAAARRLVAEARADESSEIPSRTPIVVAESDSVPDSGRSAAAERVFGSLTSTAERPARQVRPRTYRVQENDTLWGIARTCYPDLPPKRAADLIYSANKLKMPNRMVRTGDVLELP